MIRPFYFHLSSGLVILALGFSLASGGSQQVESYRSDWSEVVVPAMVAAEQDLNHLASSPRWELDLTLGQAESSALDASDLQLLGIVLSEQDYALVSVQGEVRRYKVGDIVGELEQLVVDYIGQDRIILSNGFGSDDQREIELLLYAEKDSETE